ENFAGEIVAAQLPCLVDTAENEAMPLVEQRRRAFEAWEVTVLWSKRRLKIGGIVNCVRPGVGSQKFEMVAKPFFQIRRETVINRTAVGEVGVHVAERNASGKRRRGRITGSA